MCLCVSVFLLLAMFFAFPILLNMLLGLYNGMEFLTVVLSSWKELARFRLTARAQTLPKKYNKNWKPCETRWNQWNYSKSLKNIFQRLLLPLYLLYASETNTVHLASRHREIVAAPALLPAAHTSRNNDGFATETCCIMGCHKAGTVGPFSDSGCTSQNIGASMGRLRKQ